MANTKSTQHEIPLNGGLNLNKFNAEIKPYEGFNERNSPMYGGCLSPLWIKANGAESGGVQYYKGYKWEVKEGKLYKNDAEVMSFDQSYIAKEPFYDFAGKDIPELLDENNYVEITNGSIIVHYRWDNQNRTYNVPSDRTFIDATFYKENDSKFDFALLVGYGNKQECYFSNGATVSSTEANLSSSGYSYGTAWGILDTDVLLVNESFVQINTTYINKRGYSGYYKYAATCGYTTINDKKCIVTVDGRNVAKYIVKASDDTLVYSSSYDSYSGNIPKFLMTTSSYTDELSFNFPIMFILNQANIKNSLFFHCNKSFGGVMGSFHGHNLGFGTMNLGGSTKQYFIYETDRPHSTYKVLNVVEMYNPSVVGTSIKTFDHPEWLNCSIKIFGNLPVICAKFYSVEHQDDGTTVAGGDIQQLALTNSYQGSHNIFSYIADENLTQYVSVAGGIRNKLGSSVFSIIANGDGAGAGSITGISYTGYGEYNIGTLVTPWGSVRTDKRPYVINNNCITYLDVDLKLHTKIEIKNGNNSFSFIGDYVVINTTSYLNCYHIPTGTKKHWASDWYNTFTMGSSHHKNIDEYFSNPISNLVIGGLYNINLTGGQNIGYKKTEVPSLFAEASLTYSHYNNWDTIIPLIVPVSSDTNTIEIFQNGFYVYSYLTSKVVESILVDQPAPAGNTIYNIPIIFMVYKGSLNVTLIGFGSDVRFAVLIGPEGEIRYQYYTSTITELLDVFIIQGQAYGIQDSQIYKVDIVDNVVNKESAIVDITGLNFVANTIYNAYFYSPTARAIYSFGADNNLTMFSQADTVTGITGASYMPSTGSVILGTPDCTYVLNETFGIYRLPNIKNFAYADQKADTITLVDNTNNSWEVSFEEKKDVGWEKQPVIIDTQFYGAGSNVVSVNDCWYIRVTDPEHGEGEVKLAVSTLTDIGRTTETKTIKINNKDWDDMTNTFYIRFQPKLQRAVGVSLHLESPFKVAYIGVGATPETLQLNNRGNI